MAIDGDSSIDGDNQASDPIEVMRAAIDKIRSSPGFVEPTFIKLHPRIAVKLRETYLAGIKRAEAFLRRKLSGQYQKRRRQKVNGVAMRRHEKREFYRMMLPQWRDALARMGKANGEGAV